MPVATIQMYSKALGFHTTYNVLLPNPDKVGPGPYDVLLQLHGYSDDHNAWLYKSNLWIFVENLPLIVVLPNGSNYFWADMHPTLRYESFVMQDLQGYINATFPVRQGKRWAIGGLSMGGYGALRLGMKYPDKFCSVWAHSSVIPTQEQLAERFFITDTALIKDMDCYRLAEQLDPATMPRLGFDCGTEDDLLGDNRNLHQLLERRKLPHTYNEHPGAHTWEYWDLHVRTALKQHAEVFNIQPVIG
jgi:putative tributyrin esterase